MGMFSRCKGKVGEREAAAEIARLFRVDARRGRQFSGSDDSPDIRTSIPRVHFEVKRVESLRINAALDQAICDAGASIPVVLHKQNHRPWVAIVRLDDLPELAKQLSQSLSEST